VGGRPERGDRWRGGATERRRGGAAGFLKERGGSGRERRTEQGRGQAAGGAEAEDATDGRAGGGWREERKKRGEGVGTGC